MRIVLSILFCLAASLTACGGSGGGGEGPVVGDEQERELASNDDENAIAKGKQTFGVAGNLWKPAGEEGASGAGRPVIILSPQFGKRFKSCEVRGRDGSVIPLDCNDRVPWSHNPYSCFANGGRQHWRCPCNCGDIAEVKVVCRDDNQEVTFSAAGPAIGAVCERHG